MSGRFVLVASYPKSGNTWTRIVLEQLRLGVGRPFSINELEARYVGIARRFAFDSWMPGDAADLSNGEMEELLPDLYRRLIAEIQGTVLIKVHDAARRNRRDEWIYPPDCMNTVLYLTRHPFDVAVSTAHHMSMTLERAVEVMADDGSTREPHRNMPQSLPMVFGSWSSNVESWLGNESYNVTWARYEDVSADPATHFLRFAQAAGLNASRRDVGDAVAAASFDKLQREEERAGFRERPHTSPKFFREGRSGTWKGVLEEPLRERIVRDHGRVMDRLGYGADGEVRDPTLAQ
jgi:hypothetical protein